MNALLALAVMLLLKSDRFKEVKELIERIDFESFKPVLKLLGINDGALDFLCSEKFSSLLNGQLDIKSLAELFLNPNSDEKAENGEIKEEYLGLNPIKNVAPSEIEESLGTFFS